MKSDGDVVFGNNGSTLPPKTEIVCEYNGAFKIKLRSSPIMGYANLELVKLFANSFGVAKSSVEIVDGHTSRTRRLCISGISAQQAKKLR